MAIHSFLITLLAGLAGTIGMTLIMYLYAALFGSKTKVVHIFGTMATGSSEGLRSDPKTLMAGSAGHLLIGLIFTFTYFLLWNWGVFILELWDSVVLGAISGIIAILVWRVYFYLHHHPPELSFLHYSVALFLAHIIFGIITVFTFKLFSADPEFWYQMQ